MTKGCLDTHFYVQGLPIETGDAVFLPSPATQPLCVVTYADFSARRKAWLRSFDGPQRRSFERLSKKRPVR
jgi:hypothetical protein